MKYFFVLTLLLLTDCSGPTSNNSNPPPPGWVANIQPGKFTGVWKLGNVVDSCTTNVTEADSILTASIVNRSTGEVLTLSGGFPVILVVASVRPYIHAYDVTDSSNFYSDTDSAPRTIYSSDAICTFSYNTDTLFYSTKRGNDSLFVTCIRS